nr:30S ribosomal protein S6 [Anaerolineae bacterium]
MRKYELMVVLRADLAEADLTALIETVENWINTSGGTVQEANHWGRRRLAYQIDGERDGYYIVYKLLLPPSAPPGLERYLSIAEDVLRYLITRDES